MNVPEEERHEATPTGSETRLPAATGSSTLAEPTTTSPSITVHLSKPILFNSPLGFSYLYDIATQKYYAQINSAWTLLHSTPQTILTKSQAKNITKKFPPLSPSENDVHPFQKNYGILPCAATLRGIPLIPHSTILLNAAHDSVLVPRESTKTTSGLVEYYGDKLLRPSLETVGIYMQYLRPEYVVGHQCIQLQTYGNVLYCPHCAVWYLPSIGNSPNAAAGAIVGDISYRAVPIGKLTFPYYLNELIVRSCVDPASSSGNFSEENTFALMKACFRLVDLSSIPVPRNICLGFLLRDSVFAMDFLGKKKEAWSEKYNKKRSGLSTADAIGLVRLAVAIGTLGAVS